ncbi:MAG: DUF58 domain-containing protein [Kiritimatiellae bacterium]|jgi:uncharacterized protein (DUF58 family)|nr:DUF58 domain-containing protein [Kiritimatiellia bacterium]
MSLRTELANFGKWWKQPPVGYQHGRRGTTLGRMPVIHWFYYHFEAHFTIRFGVFAVIGIAPTAYVMMMGFRSEFCAVGFALFSWMFISIIVGLFSTPDLNIDVKMPERVECGSVFETIYDVQNVGKKCARYVDVDTLIYPDVLCFTKDTAWIANLPAGEKTSVSAFGHAKRRGVYTMPGLRYDSRFPGGFWRWGYTGKGSLLSIYPKYARLISMDVPLGTGNQNELSAANKLTREAFEFHGCREFREGDLLRHVHPRSSARVGTLVVKEFQSEGRLRTAVLVDTQIKRSAMWMHFSNLTKNEPIEAAISLSASIVDFLSVTDRVLDLLVAGPQVYRFVSTGRVGYFEEVLDILASIEPFAEDPFEKLESLLFEEIRMIQSVCLVLINWDERRRELVQDLLAYDVGVKIVLITPDGNRPADYPVDELCLSAKEILEGEVCSL